MSSTTPNLGLTYLAAAQSQPEVIINAAWDLIDAAAGAATSGAAADTTAIAAATAAAAAATDAANAAQAQVTALAATGPTPIVTSVANLPTGVLKGVRAFVYDATDTTFLSIVAGGGANNVPVVFDGNNWVIG